ncbi:MAG: hypothetical protein SXQ77_05845, partial [Halobacteria archaeon]|nr:hypothetical protein [Halobacteria archaeon]
DEYWAPVGVWQIRESVRIAFDDETGGATAETFHGVVKDIAEHLPVSLDALRRKSVMASGIQTGLDEFF